MGLYCRQSLVEHLDADELVEDHRAGLRVLREDLRLPLPVRQVRPALRAGVQHGRDGERRLRDLPRRVPPAQPPGPLVLRVPRRGDPPRDGAHVVRRPRDHEVVGRPLAQRVVRRVGVLPRGRQRHGVHRVLDRLHQRPQELGLPPGPAAQHPPDRRGQLRPAGGRGQLRRHHLRQGRLGAQAAGRLGRPRPVPRGAARLLRGLRVLQRGVQGPADGPGEGVRPRAGVVGAGVAPDRRRQHAGAGVRARRRRHLRVVRHPADRRARLPDAAPAPARRGPLRQGRGPAGPAYVVRDRRRGRAVRGGAGGGPEAARPAAAQRRRPRLRQDPARRALARHPGHQHRDHRRLAGPGAVLGRGLGHDPRRRDVRERLRDPRALGHRVRDRRVRRQPAARLRRHGRDALLRPRAPRGAARQVGDRPAWAADDRGGR